jgi:hypothetical protein
MTCDAAQVKGVRRLFVLFAVVIALQGTARCQVNPAARAGSGLSIFMSFGGIRTQESNDIYRSQHIDHSLGVDGGVYVQRSPLRGVEVRGGTYRMNATYSQSHITAGYRAESGNLWDRGLYASGYVGGGLLRTVDAAGTYKGMPPNWSACWQVSHAMSAKQGKWQWKAYEVTWIQANTPRHRLRGVSLSTGVIYTFSRGREPLGE